VPVCDDALGWVCGDPCILRDAVLEVSEYFLSHAPAYRRFTKWVVAGAVADGDSGNSLGCGSVSVGEWSACRGACGDLVPKMLSSVESTLRW
jgi:hypothetical protein